MRSADRRIWNSLLTIALLGGVACSAERGLSSSESNRSAGPNPPSGRPGPDTSTVPPPPPPPTGPGPVVTLTVAPAAASIRVGHYVALVARPLNANGQVVTGQIVQWSTLDASVAVVSDTGLVRGVAPGRTSVVATVAGLTANASIRVVASDTVPPPPPPPPRPPVAQFDLEGIVRGVLQGPDTTQTVPVAAAVVRLFRTVSPPIDSTRPPPPPVPPVFIGQATSDATGRFDFRNLAPGSYRLTVAAPPGSPFGDGQLDFTPSPFDSVVRVIVHLRPGP
jgi:hypothetical protein